MPNPIVSPANEHLSTCDVLIVGAGPAGLTAAVTLARRGVDVLVVERHLGTSPFPKAIGVSTRTMELFRSWGIEERIRAGAMSVPAVMTVSRTLSDGVMFTMPFDFPSDEAALAVSPCTPSCCAQDHLEPVLLDHLREQGGRVRFGVEMTGLVDGPDGVSADIADRTTGRLERVQAKFLIGADGPRSSVRTMLGIGIDDLGTIGEFVAVTFRADLERRLGRLPGALNMVELSGAEGIFVPTSRDGRWIYCREWHPERGDCLDDRTESQWVELIRSASGFADLEPQISSVQPFVMGGHVAETFSRGHVFLVGDAVHRTTPVGGTGMNTAIHAAHNLGWKLSVVLDGWAGDALLASYEDERRPIGTRNVLRSLRRGPAGERPAGAQPGPGPGPGPGGAAGSTPDAGPDSDWLAGDIGVRYSSTAILLGRPSPSADGAQPGERAPHAWLRGLRAGVTSPRISTLDLFDGQFTLLSRSRNGRARALARSMFAQGLPIAAVSVGSTELDVDCDLLAADDRFDRDYQLAEQQLVLVRPDGYIAWRGRAGVGGSAALQAVVVSALGGRVGAQDRTDRRRAG